MGIRLTRPAFRRLVREVLESLPERVLALMENVDVVVQPWPEPRHLEAMGLESPYDLLGYYEGVPRTERTTAYTMALPDRIYLFQRPLEAVSESLEALRAEVRRTLLHELAHHLGWPEGEMERLGLA